MTRNEDGEYMGGPHLRRKISGGPVRLKPDSQRSRIAATSDFGFDVSRACRRTKVRAQQSAALTCRAFFLLSDESAVIAVEGAVLSLLFETVRGELTAFEARSSEIIVD
jgi:hypothetical protein